MYLKKIPRLEFAEKNPGQSYFKGYIHTVLNKSQWQHPSCVREKFLKYSVQILRSGLDLPVHKFQNIVIARV